MVKKAPSKLRALDPDLSRFVKDNVSNPTRALRDMRSIHNDAAPPPEPVTRKDLLRQPGPRNLRAQFDQGTGVTEVNGPSYTGPATVIRHTHSASPAPAVSSAAPRPYRAAGSGETVLYQPLGSPVPPGVNPADELGTP